MMLVEGALARRRPQLLRRPSRRDRNHPLKHRGVFGSSMTAEKINDMMLT